MCSSTESPCTFSQLPQASLMNEEAPRQPSEPCRFRISSFRLTHRDQKWGDGQAVFLSLTPTSYKEKGGCVSKRPQSILSPSGSF